MIKQGNNPFKLDSLDDCYAYMHIMTDFYYDVIYATSTKPVTSCALNDSRTWLQMMFSKGVHFCNALQGFEYAKGLRHLNRISDHTILFSLVRDMFESYIVFRLIYSLPQTDDQQQILYYLYCHAGLQEHFDNVSSKVKEDNPEWEEDQLQQMEVCRAHIFETQLYQQEERVRRVVDNALKSKVNKFRYYFDAEGNMQFVKFEAPETLEILQINSTVFDGIYHYLSQMAHPSYKALEQFSIAYKDLEKGSIMLASTATRYAITILSLFIREYELLFPEVRKLFNMQSPVVQQQIALYGDIVIKDAHQRNSV